MELLTLLAALWRRKWIVVLSVVTMLGAAIAASIVLPRSYSATTEVLVAGKESASSLLNDLGLPELAMSLTNTTDDIQNKIYLVTAPEVVEQSIWKLQLRDDDGELYAVDDITDGGLLSSILGKPSISVTQVSGTDVLEIEVTAPTPEGAALFADTVAQTYTAHTTEIARGDIRDAQRFIQDQLAEVTKELDAAFAEVAVAQRENEIIDLDAEVRAAVARLSDLLGEQTTVAAKIRESRARMSTVQRQREREGIASVSSTTMTSNPVIGKLRTQLTELRSQRASLLADNHTELSPEVKELDHRVVAAENELRSALSESADLDPTVAGLQADLAGLLQRAEEINDGIDRTTGAFASYPDKLRKLSRLEVAASAAEAVYRSLQDQRFQIGVAEAMTMADVRVVAAATLPDKPDSPKVLVNVLAGLFLGFVLGCGSALALEYVDDTVSDAAALRAAWDVPQLGLIPRYRSSTTPVLVTLPPTDPIVETHRIVRNAIGFVSVDKPVTLLAVSSAIPGEGKSTTAVNLALAFAMEGKRTLLVDGDLRMPSQHRNFAPVVAKPGLVEVIGRSHAAADVVQETGHANLSILVAGELPPDPGHLVGSLRMRQTLLELSRSYDVVILDTPPILAVGDALVFGHVVDGIVLVAEAGRITRRMLHEVQTRLESAGIKPLGVVLNKVRSSANPYGTYARAYAKRRRKVSPKRAGGGAA